MRPVRPIRKAGTIASASLVPEVRFELTHPSGRRILNPLRLPFRHSGTPSAYRLAGNRSSAGGGLTGTGGWGIPMAGQTMRAFRNLYHWTLSLAAHPRALWALAFVAFIEASVFPIPPDVLIIAMIIAAPHRAFVIAGVATLASVTGGLLGYAIGALAFETVGYPVLSALGKGAAVEAFNTRFNDFGFWPVLIGGLTPFPYKVITIMSGWTGLPLATFVVTSIIARAARFFLVAALLWKFGAPIRDFIDRRLGLLSVVFVVLLAGGFYAVRYL